MSAFDPRWDYGAPRPGTGVITACDAQQEWLLPWWWLHYSAHSALPVLFADHGMTAAARAWCAERGLVVQSAVQGLGITSQKPFALLKSPFERTIWMDADCEVCADVAPLFTFTPPGAIGVTLDNYNAGLTAAMPSSWQTVAAGVIVYDRDDAFIPQWAALLVTGAYRDDQYALNALIPSRRFYVLPPHCQRLRFESEDGVSPIIRHWHGLPGKAHIRSSFRRARIPVL